MKNISLVIAVATLINCHQLSAQKNIQLLGHLQYPGNVSCSNLTGYVDSAGNEYALVGTSQGLSIVDVSNPASPVQKFTVPGATGQGGFWREVREYNGFAYVTTEETSGLVVVDLRHLPDSIKSHQINPDGMTKSHTIFIDEKGVAYVNGTNKGLLFLDCAANGWNPPLLGKYENFYVHDCFARNDTLWAACINDGFVIAIDVANKAQTNSTSKVLAQWNTPQNFSHNCWLSDDGKYIFTTDEKPASYLTCYDISDLSNVTETDRTQIEPGSNTIIHNTYYLNDYCVTSYYTYGITIHDVTRKNNLVEVGSFDSSPNFSGDGFNGAWGVWPYLPSGNIIISDIETGLWIVKPTYKRACYLEGTVRDSVCNTLLNNVLVEIVEDTTIDYTNFLGKYSFGTPDTGTYTIRFSKQGYATKVVNGVQLINGQLTTINTKLIPVATTNLVVRTLDTFGLPLPFVKVLVTDSAGNDVDEFATDLNAEHKFCDFVQGSYTFYAGRWGKITAKVSRSITAISDTITFTIANGYYDDFVMDYGWTVSSTASKGSWERGKPVGTDLQGTPSNPGVDISSDFGVKCFVTGNGGGQAGEDDVDDGNTILRSPLFNLQAYTNPSISYYSWFYNGGGQGTAPNDSLVVRLSNGIDTVTIDKKTAASAMSQWTFSKIRVKDFIALSQNMRIEFIAMDNNPGHLVEAGLDVFTVTDTADTDTIIGLENDLMLKPTLATIPNPFQTNWVLNVKDAPVNATVVLSNTYGQKMFEQQVSSSNQLFEMPSHYSNGVYYVQLLQAGQILAYTKVLKW